MSDLKISELNTATSLLGDELMPVVQDGETKKTTISNVLDSVSESVIADIEAAGDTEIANIAAAAGAVFYANTTAGLAATADQGYFLVVGDGTNTYAYLYKDNAGVAVLIASYPSKTALDTAIATGGGATPRVNILEKSHSSNHLIGNASTLVTGSGITNITPIFARSAEKAGYIYEVGAYGVNSGGNLALRLFTLASTTYTQVGSDTNFTLVAGLNTFTLGSGLTQYIQFDAGTHFGFFAYATTGKVANVSAGTPTTLYYSHTGNFTGGTQGSLVTSFSTQFYIKVRYEDGTEESFTDAVNSEISETVWVGRDTTVVDTGSGLADSSNVHFIPFKIGVSGVVEEWHVAASNAGPLRFFLAELTGGNTINIYKTFTKTVAVGANTFKISDGTLPTDLVIYPNTVRGYLSQNTASGGKLAYSNSSSTVGTPPHHMQVATSGGAWGSTVFTYNSNARRYEERLKIKRPISPKKINFLNQATLIDEDFSEGTLVPGLDANGTWTFSAGQALSGSTGLTSGLELTRGQAWNYNYALVKFQLNSATDSVYIGLKDVTGNWSSIAVVDGNLNQFKVYNAWVGGSSFPAGVYSTKTGPFTNALNSTRNYQIEFIRENRKFTFRLTDLTSFEQWDIVKDFNTWSSSNDLSDVGLMHGGLIVGAVSGAIKVKYMLQECQIKNPRVLIFSDSMMHSRTDVSNAVGYKIAANCRGGGLLVHVDGTPTNSARILVENMLRYHPSVEEVIFMFGMNDGSADRATSLVQYPVAIRYCQNAGAHVTLCTVPPNASDALGNYTDFYPELNDDIRSYATTYGCGLIPFDISHTVNGDGITRDDTLFSTESGSIDVHFNTLGHAKAYAVVKAYAPYLGLYNS